MAYVVYSVREGGLQSVIPPLGMGSGRTNYGSREVTSYFMMLFFCVPTSPAGSGYNLHPDPANATSYHHRAQNQEPGCASGASQTFAFNTAV